MQGIRGHHRCRAMVVPLLSRMWCRVGGRLRLFSPAGETADEPKIEAVGQQAEEFELVGEALWEGNFESQRFQPRGNLICRYRGRNEIGHRKSVLSGGVRIDET